MNLLRNKPLLFVLILTLAGVALRFYNLNWGAPFYFHPDERNIASSVSQLVFPSNFHPHFFAYGSLPIYVIFLTGILSNFLTSAFGQVAFTDKISFEQAIIISRSYSALFSTLLIPLLFFAGRKLFNLNTGLLASVLGLFCTGFIQFAHFGTFEMWLTFFTFLLFLTCISFTERGHFKFSLLSGSLLGVLAAIKVSSLALLSIPLFCLLSIIFYNSKLNKMQVSARELFHFVISLILFLLVAILIYATSNPYVTLDTEGFAGSMKYESGVALGSIPVFYTGEFINSLPVIFHFQRVLPFLINPIMTLLFVPFFLYFLFICARERKHSYLILLLFFLITFFSQTFLYVKWIRYLVPVLPFMILIISITIFSLTKYFARSNILLSIFISILIVSSSLFSLSYFLTAYVEKDTRIQAYEYAQRTIPSDAVILSEVYDLGIVPFNDTFRNISLFHFYDLDHDSPDATNEALSEAVASSEYIILPSQRIHKVRLLNHEKYPHAAKFYKDLFSGKLGFVKLYESPCSVFCQITYLTNPIYSFEQTANVFDRPSVMIYRKM